MVALIEAHPAAGPKPKASTRTLRLRCPRSTPIPAKAGRRTDPERATVVETALDRTKPGPEDLPLGAKALKRSDQSDTAAGEAWANAQAELPAPRARERDAYDGNSALTLYMREIGQVKLLSPEEEIKLAARVKKGDKQAREQMIKANLRLVVKIARDYENIGLPLLDLISEGNIGLMKAVERFDPAKGGKLSTYSAWWIKQSIKRALANQSKTIRLPVHLVDKISRMRRTALRLQEELGREPTDEELGEEMGCATGRVTRMRLAAIRPASLDAPLSDEDSGTFGEVVQDEGAETPFQQLDQKTLTNMLHEMLQRLDRREAIILRARFGLDGGNEKTLEEVGKKLGVTRERVRQLQNLALNRLRDMIEHPKPNPLMGPTALRK